jgi:hypothetical protein
LEDEMHEGQTRRDMLKGTLALTGLGMVALPGWVLPALAQGETLVPFTDIPATANFTPAVDRRLLDLRRVEGPFTPPDQFFTTQHYGHPTVDAAAFRLTISVASATRSSWRALNARATGARCRACRATVDGRACRSRPCSIGPA